MDKERKIKIKIYFKCKDKIIKEFSIDKYSTTFGDILDLFYNDIKKEYNQYRLKNKYLYNQKELEKKDIILNLLMNEHINIHNIKEIKIEIFLDEIYNLYDQDLPKYDKLIIPIRDSNSFELYIYYPEKGNIDIEEYYKNIFEEYLLYKIDEKTSFCNSHNYLFLSGGEYKDEILNDFWIIDNSQFTIKNLFMPSPKTNHSMFNINDENILIIGGQDTKTYLFNTKKNDFIFFGNTNNSHISPFIIFLNNYIFCFSEQKETIFAEKKLFSLENNSWENINLSLLNSQTDTAISKTDTLLIIFDNKKYYEFSPENNSIKKINLNEDENYLISVNSSDKNFYKLNKYYSACISKNFKEEKALYVLNKKWRKMHKMSFEHHRYSIKYQYHESTDIVDKENIIKIEAKFKNEEESNKIIKMKNSKTILKDININENDLTNLDDEILINEISTPKEDHNEYEHKSSKNQINLIVPKNVIYDQLIHRTSDLEEDEDINKRKNILHIDVDNLGNGVEDIFTPIKKDLPSPNLYNDLNNDNKNKEESIIFEQINMENQSGDNLLDLSNEKPKKRFFKFTLSDNMLDDHYITRVIKSENLPKNKSFNYELNNEEIIQENKKDEQKIKLNEQDIVKQEDNKDIIKNEEQKNESLYQKDNDLFLSTDAFAI